MFIVQSHFFVLSLTLTHKIPGLHVELAQDGGQLTHIGWRIQIQDDFRFYTVVLKYLERGAGFGTTGIMQYLNVQTGNLLSVNGLVIIQFLQCLRTK